MEKEIIKKWYNNKKHLSKFLKSLKRKDVDRYEKLVHILIKDILNHHIGDYDPEFSDDLVHLDHGNGMEVYLLYTVGYGGIDYYMFSNSYGSCAVCDALEGILDRLRDDDPLTEDIIKQLMDLMLHMVQRLKHVLHV